MDATLPVEAPDNEDPVLGAGDELVPGVGEGDVEHLVSVAQGTLQHLCSTGFIPCDTN